MEIESATFSETFNQDDMNVNDSLLSSSPVKENTELLSPALCSILNNVKFGKLFYREQKLSLDKLPATISDLAAFYGLCPSLEHFVQLSESKSPEFIEKLTSISARFVEELAVDSAELIVILFKALFPSKNIRDSKLLQEVEIFKNFITSLVNTLAVRISYGIEQIPALLLYRWQLHHPEMYFSQDIIDSLMERRQKRHLFASQLSCYYNLLSSEEKESLLCLLSQPMKTTPKRQSLSVLPTSSVKKSKKADDEENLAKKAQEAEEKKIKKEKERIAKQLSLVEEREKAKREKEAQRDAKLKEKEALKQAEIEEKNRQKEEHRRLKLESSQQKKSDPSQKSLWCFIKKEEVSEKATLPSINSTLVFHSQQPSDASAVLSISTTAHHESERMLEENRMASSHTLPSAVHSTLSESQKVSPFDDYFKPFYVKPGVTMSPQWLAMMQRHHSHTRCAPTMIPLDDLLSQASSSFGGKTSDWLQIIKETHNHWMQTQRTTWRQRAVTDDIFARFGRMKFLSFYENRRPPYYGTFSKHRTLDSQRGDRVSLSVNGRTPFQKDSRLFCYDEDSEEEWEEEPEDAESLASDEEDDDEEEEENSHNEGTDADERSSDDFVLEDGDEEETKRRSKPLRILTPVVSGVVFPIHHHVLPSIRERHRYAIDGLPRAYHLSVTEVGLGICPWPETPLSTGGEEVLGGERSLVQHDVIASQRQEARQREKEQRRAEKEAARSALLEEKQRQRLEKEALREQERRQRALEKTEALNNSKESETTTTAVSVVLSCQIDVNEVGPLVRHVHGSARSLSTLTEMFHEQHPHLTKKHIKRTIQWMAKRQPVSATPVGCWHVSTDVLALHGIDEREALELFENNLSVKRNQMKGTWSEPSSILLSSPGTSASTSLSTLMDEEQNRGLSLKCTSQVTLREFFDKE